MEFRILKWSLLLCLLVGMVGCNTTKFVPDGEYLLDEVILTSDHPEVKAGKFTAYVRQHPNTRWLSKLQVPLGLYSLASKDSTKRSNKFWHKLGQAPVIYSQADADLSAQAIQQAVMTYGYLAAQVDTRTKTKGKRIKAYYHIHPKEVYKVQSIHWEIADARVDSILRADSLNNPLRPGMEFSMNLLNDERNRITNKLKDLGYFQFNKDFVSFQADTCQGTRLVDLTLRVRNQVRTTQHQPYTVNKVNIYASSQPTDSMQFEGYMLYYKDKMRMRPRVLTHASDLHAGDLYSQNLMQNTYNNYSRLSALRYTNIRYQIDPNDSLGLIASIHTDFTKFHSISAELEGTNSAGDLGAAASISYAHTNVFRGSETFRMKLRGAYEAITHLEGYSNKDYVEMGVEASLNFPRFLLPFVRTSYMKEQRALSGLSIQYNWQNRPEFHRRVASGVWRYRWTSRNNKFSHRFDLLDLNYVYMPWISPTFKKEYLDNLDNYNAILRYNYEDLFITKLGYSFTYNSQGLLGATGSNMGTNSYTIRANFESSGNFLYAINNLLGGEKNKDGYYTVANIAYAQYVKGDFDLSKSIRLGEKQSLALHLGVGVAFPYGNSTILPFEKRYFSGGANSVRGWSVRTLGPGSYSGTNGAIDYINQSGDIKLDMNIEYRSHLFWKFDGAVFADAGNIWTIREYKEQPGGQFKLDTFYQQLAASYGVGLRLMLGYFILRFDGGMRAVNPAYSNFRDQFCIFYPKFSRDFTFHFAVGMPF